MKFLYTLSIHLYNLAIRIAALFNTKAKLWVKGREDIFQKLEADFKNRNNAPTLVWVHCASLGEFEQGRPLIEQIRREKDVKILLTFFSPSGYEIRKNYDNADYIYYLPADTQINAKKFISIVKPDIAIFVKYEFWFNYLNQLKKQQIPTYLVCGIFRENQHFFKNYGSWFRKQLSAFTHFYLQDGNSENQLKRIGYNNTTVAGDTRFDRVVEIAKNTKAIELVKHFVSDKKIIIAGSTWQEDINILARIKFQQAGYKMIIAPHEIAEENIRSTMSQFHNLFSLGTKVIRYSQATEETVVAADVLIIDNIGMLSSLYQYGTIAFIGGGFGKGIHNILEAATFALPVIFGPNYHKFNEAKELIQKGGAYSISSYDALQKTINSLNNSGVLRMASFEAKNYVVSHAGATDKILNTLTLKPLQAQPAM